MAKREVSEGELVCWGGSKSCGDETVVEEGKKRWSLLFYFFLFLFIFETEMLPLIVIEAELSVGAGEPEAEPPSRAVVYRLYRGTWAVGQA